MNGKKWEIDLHGLLLIVVTVAWLAGIFLNSLVQLPPLFLLIGAAIALVCAIVLWKSDPGILLSLVALWFLLGAWRYAMVSPVNDQSAISKFIGTKNLAVQGAVAAEPTLEAHSRLLTIDVHSVSTDNGSTWQDTDGRMDVTILGSSIDNPYGPNYGDSVELRGRLGAPAPHSTPDIFASMDFPALTVSASGGNPVIAALFQLRTKFAIIIQQSLPQPLAALLIAILLSLRTPALMPLIAYFNETGTAHLIAPSGFKVTIVAGLISASTRWLYEGRSNQAKQLPAQKRRDWRQWLATTLVLLSIIGYTILTGAGPAAIRAGVMGTLLVIAPRIGRTYNFYTALAFTALLMTMVDPFILWDGGFQLSFAGTLGIVIYTPLFQRLFRALEHIPSGYLVAEIIAVTLAAQTATWPIIGIFFSQVSFSAAPANVLSVPLLGVLIVLGMLVCIGGLFFIQIGIFFGWIVLPVLWFLQTIITGFANFPVYPIPNNMAIPWSYYGLLGLLSITLYRRWPEAMQVQTAKNASPLFSRRTWRILQISAALIIVLATGVSVLAAQPSGQLTITFLDGGLPGQHAQGESILIHTPDGKTLLIDGGSDATSLAQALDGRLPFWQRSLDAVILTTPRQDHLVGLQDIITRYQVGEVIDAGMLHPNTGYAIWRRTINERGFTYVQVRQQATISLGTQVMLQVLWPPSPLHKSSDEALDNALVMRLVAPGIRILLLGVAAMSKYALNGLLSTVNPGLLQADVIQVVGEVGKTFPGPLSSVLQLAHSSHLIITPAALSAQQRKAHQTSIITPVPFAGTSWQVLQTAQASTVEISSNGNGWNFV